MNEVAADIPAQGIVSPRALTARRPTVVVQPSRGWALPDLRDLWLYRDLLLLLALRDIKLRYKQTFLGITWVVLQPLVAGVIFAVVFGRFARLPSHGTPYLLLVFCGLLPWNYLSGTLQRAGSSLIADARLISKVYFPRLLLPVASSVAVLVDSGITLVLLAVLMAIYGIAPTWRIAALPFFLGVTIVMAIGASLWLSALSVRYRDFIYAAPFLIQVWTYASPVAYSAAIVPKDWQWLYSLNPAAGFIEGFRWALLGHGTLSVQSVVAMTLIAALTLVSGAIFFRRVERTFADVV